LGGKDEKQLVYDADFLFVKVCLLDDDICSEGKSERHVAADVDTAVLLLVPSPLSKPQSETAREAGRL
jgi:hypothetical protein